MKAALFFRLPEEADEHDMALKGASYRYALDEMDNFLRGKLKYQELDPAAHAAFQEARSYLNELMRSEEQ